MHAQVVQDALNTHNKRPNHPSPVPSCRPQERHAVSKRPRWDVLSPTPSPPVLSVPLPSSNQHHSLPKQQFYFASDSSSFNFGFKAPSSPAQPSSPNVPYSARVKRHRAHTTSHTHAHAPHSRSKERSNRHPYWYPRIASNVVDPEDDMEDIDDNLTAFERLRRSTFDQGELFVNSMRDWERERSGAESSSVTTENSASSPYMSHSVTSNSTTGSSSGYGSECPPPSFPMRAEAGGRKRSWSIVEGDDEPAFGSADMEWEVVSDAPPQGIAIGRPTAAIGIPIFHHTEMNVEVSPESLSSSGIFNPGEDGDDEQEDDESDEDSDDDLIFVIGSPNTTVTGISRPAPDRILEEISQVIAAGAGSLDDVDSEAFVDVAATTSSQPVIDAGALWN